MIEITFLAYIYYTQKIPVLQPEKSVYKFYDFKVKRKIKGKKEKNKTKKGSNRIKKNLLPLYC